ncbi:MAG: Tyrosine--tRNA ligase [Alphaproteobacteria bacterium MarineAlpha9_Bin7]|nr:MAG: Tyrosine--tRNA ligase [Alphaproteobacteria bacterium MarineAlpha9_Bin7]
MTTPKSELLRTIVARGYLHQCTDLEGLDALAVAQPIVGYIGFDCTADSLHVGSLVPIMLLRHLQQAGHRPVVLLGGGTTMIGDPSGKDSGRKLLSDDEINRNMLGIRQIFERFVKFGEGPTDAVLVNNAEWLCDLNYVKFLRNYGRHFSVNRMLSFDSIKLRLEREQPLSFLEFNYMVLQAYDFLELARRYACVLQLGGSDQWGNIVNGVELGRRVENKSLFGLTSPLLQTASGEKMGKTAMGAVWLNEERLSNYDYWQYWRNVDDADVGRFLRLFTELPLQEIDSLEKLEGAEINDAKILLADHATTLCRGVDAAESASRTARDTFERRGLGDELPAYSVPRESLSDGISVVEAFQLVGLGKSNGEVRRLIRGGGARINDVAVRLENHAVTMDDLDKNGVVKLSAGKKRHAILRPINNTKDEL